MAPSLDVYWKLASRDAAVRQEGTLELVQGLKDATSEDLEYALGRLTKGLASSRQDSRIGFSVALSELLLHRPDVSPARVVAQIVQNTHADSKATGQEVRDANFGKLFGFQAVVQSGVLTASASAVDADTIAELIRQLLLLSQSKGWMRETCGHVIYSLLSACRGRMTHELRTVFEHELLSVPQVCKTPEGLAYYMLLTSPDFACACPVWRKHPLDKASLPETQKIMKQLAPEAKADERGATPSGVGWKPRLHFSWEILLQQFAEPACPFSLSTFWTVLVDEGLFAAVCSLERKYWGFRVAELALATLGAAVIPLCLSQNFLRTIINHLAEPDRYLHKVAKKWMSTVVKFAEENSCSLAVLKVLVLGKAGSLYFDRITKTKTVDALVTAGMPKESVSFLQGLFLDPPIAERKDERALHSARVYIIELMISYVRANKDSLGQKYLSRILGVFCTYGFVKTGGDKISDSTRAALRTRVVSLVSVLKSDGEGRSVNYSHICINLIMAAAKDAEFATALSEDATEQLSQAIKLLKRIERKVQKRPSSELYTFESLTSLITLTLLCGENDAAAVIPELCTFYTKLFSKKADASESEDEEEEEDVSQMLTDMLLSLLSKPSAALRKTVEAVFESIAPRLTLGSLMLLVKVVHTPENADAKSDLFQDEDDANEVEDEEDEDEDEEEEEEDEDEEEADTPDNAPPLKRRRADSESEPDGDQVDISDVSWESDDSDNGDTEADRALDQALASALQAQGGAESSGSDEEGMDDDQMMLMDAHLSRIFAERKKATTQKKESQQVKEQIIMFKSKTIDVIDLYTKAVPESVLLFEMIMPMLEAYGFSSTKAIHDKLTNVIKNRLFKASPIPTDLLRLLEILRDIHSFAATGPTGVPPSCITQCCIMVVRAIAASGDDEMLRAAFDVYKDSFLGFVTQPKLKLQSALFTDLVNWGTQWRRKSEKKTNGIA